MDIYAPVARKTPMYRTAYCFANPSRAKPITRQMELKDIMGARSRYTVKESFVSGEAGLELGFLHIIYERSAGGVSSGELTITHTRGH